MVSSFEFTKCGICKRYRKQVPTFYLPGGTAMQRITIKDIARIAGVSVTTVSRALNHSADISEDTKERILRICQEEG